MQVLRHLPPTIPNPDLLVGLDTGDDAGVYRLTEELALVQTVDYFTPVVDDPYAFGQIAAANALSDLYAMGARPLTALNIVGFPIKKLPHAVLGQILCGGADKLAEAGCALLGGHSIDDAEPKYGLAVTGVVHPAKAVTNGGAMAGDALVLTKPIGIGIVTTAHKRGLASPATVERVTALMATLNKAASGAMVDAGASACTDITGFGLLGHASEMARASGVGLEIRAAAVPILEETWEFLRAGAIPGGSKANLEFITAADPVGGGGAAAEGGPLVEFAAGVTGEMRAVLADACTSGGLLISITESRLEKLLGLLAAKGVETRAVIGRAVAEHPGRIMVTE